MSGPPVSGSGAPDSPSGSPKRKLSVSQLPPEAVELATKLFNFARQGATQELQQYLEAGIPANLTNATGDTLLMLAAYHGHAATVDMLAKHGADPNTLNDKGQAPIAGAVFKLHDEVVRTLIAAGADVTAGQPNAIDCAKMFKRDDLLPLLQGTQGDK